MKNVDWQSFFQAVAIFLVAVAGVLKSWQNGRKVDETNTKVDANTAITKDTHEAVNGKMATFVDAVKATSFAEGVKDQVDRQAEIQTVVNAAKDKSI